MGVSRIDKVRDEERCRAGIDKKLVSTVDERELRWFGHMKRMDEHSMARRVLMSGEIGERVRGRPRLGWMECVKEALFSKGMTVEAARQENRKERIALVYMYIYDGVSLDHFSLDPAFFRTALPHSGGLSPGEWLDAVT